MKFSTRFLSALMAFLTIFGTLAVFSTLPIFAETSGVSVKTTGSVRATIDYINQGFASKEEKLATMTLKLERFGYELYYEPYTGEVAVKNTKTGDILMTNPYDVGSAKSSENIKNQLLSQIILKYTNNQGQELNMYSYVDAALLGQVKVKNIKNGIRVEYIMGQQEARSLVPERIEKNRYLEQIFNRVDDKGKKTLDAFFVLKDPNQEGLTERQKEQILKQYPITETYAIYVFDTTASNREKNRVEAIIKQFCPDYTFEERDYDHNLVEYEADDETPPQFRMALEYYLDESGLSVRLPANGIRFDQSTFTLDWIRILPYIGASSSEYSGYTMIPDGSGALVRTEDVLSTGTSRVLTGSLYGHDYAYHKITGANQQVMRLPIFGLVENTEYETVNEETGETESYIRKNGYIAIIEEGDALASITTNHGGNISHKYNSVYTEFNPRPKDSYNLASSISVSGVGTWTVVSERKYTGSYRIRYIMLTDMEYAAENDVDAAGLFDTSYVGMGLAYRDQLLKSGALEALNTDEEQIPLYLETLGVMDVQEKFLSIPVMVKKALTTFDDIKTMTEELGEAGINNLVYKLTGYINGGLKGTLANQIDVEKVAGNDGGLEELQEYMEENGKELYLDVDFSYAKEDKLFDGFSKKKQAVRTIDDRYTQKRTYSAALQAFTSTGMIAISPSVFEDIFEDLEGDLEDLGLTGVSLGTVGSDLNSDFDEDDPYNREDSKGHIVDVLKQVREAGYKIMMDGGNAFALPYAEHVLNVTLDSSKYTYASEAIPLYGIVFHGYLNFAGKATNTAGDIRYEMLKIIENGANPYFILVYRNSEKLKEDKTLSSYFSISYENWKEDLIATYNKLNAVLAPVMNSPIVDHEFLLGERVPEEDEIAADKEAAEKAEEEAKRQEEESIAESERQDNLKDHLASKHPEWTETSEEVTDVPSETDPDATESETESTEAETTPAATTTAPREPGIPADPDKEGYEYTKYTVDNGMIVKVTYENGYVFILNYNIYDVTVAELGETAVPALGYVVLNAEGEIVINSGEEAAA